MQTPTHFLVPIDFSPYSDHAAEMALALARATGARVEFVHAHAAPGFVPTGMPSLSPSPGDNAESLRDAEDAATIYCSRFSGCDVPFEVRVIPGNPERVIAEAAQRDGVDLIVMGTHGRSGLKKAILGSVTEQVLRTSKLPVLAVPLKD